MATPQKRTGETAARVISGAWFTMLGQLGDVAAAYLLVAQQVLQSMVLHVLAVGVWALGIHLLSLRSATAPSDTRRGIAARTLSGWTISAMILGLFLFPGLGTLGISVAFLFSFLFRRRRIPHLTLGDTLASMQIPALVLRANSGGTEEPVMPLVDVLREQNTEMRRAVVRTLGDQGDQGSVEVLRRLLSDTSPDVRGDAAVILTRLENDYSQRIVRLLTAEGEEPQDAELRLRLARLYFEFADSGLLDPVSSRFYLGKARAIYQSETEAHPNRSDLFVDLARIYEQMERPSDAINILRFVLRKRPEHLPALRLLLEIAFAEQEWGLLLTTAQEVQALDPDQGELMRWWTAIIPPTWKGTAHG